MPDPGEVREAWGRYAPSFAAEGTAAEDRASVRELLRMVDPTPGSLVLDVATGAGYTAFAFARIGCRPVGLDPTLEMLDAARMGWSERGLPGGMPVVSAWAEALPFADGSFDVVVAHRAPHQFEDADAWLREAHRVLRVGGLLGLADQSPPDGMGSWHNELERLRDPTHGTARSPRQWAEAVRTAGFGEIRSTVVGQPHDVEEWLDRVDAAPFRRTGVREFLRTAPLEVREAYDLTGDEPSRMVTPQCVLVAER